jgi:REP element-mobilizing transposase RayT
MQRTIAMPRGYEKGEAAVHLMNYHFTCSAKDRRRILVAVLKV